MTEVWQLEKLNLCRCCHSEGKAYKNIYSKSFWLGDEEEAYIKVLQECFNIELAPVSELVKELLCTICDDCITTLRNATVFKHQVLKCERMFKKIYLGSFGDDGEADVKIKHEKNDDSEDETIRTVVEIIPDVDKKPSGEELASASGQGFDDSDDDYLSTFKFDDSPEPEPEPESSKKSKTNKKTGKQKAKAKDKPTKKKAKEKDGQEKGEKGGSILEARLNSSKRPIIRLQEDTHYRRVVRDSTLFFQCCICNKEFKQNQFEQIKKHITYHLKVPKYTCPYCGKDFKRPETCTKHKLEEHNVDERFKCNACDKTYYCRNLLNSHYKSFHMLGKKFKCDLCEYESFKAISLRRHKDRHKSEKDFHCAYCKKSFVRKRTLIVHERIHTGDKRKVCKICGQAFVQKASLTYHMNKYHPGVN